MMGAGIGAGLATIGAGHRHRPDRWARPWKAWRASRRLQGNIMTSCADSFGARRGRGAVRRRRGAADRTQVHVLIPGGGARPGARPPTSHPPDFPCVSCVRLCRRFDDVRRHARCSRRKPAAPGGTLMSLQSNLMFWTLLIFLVLFFLLTKFAFKPITAAVEAREKSLEEALDRRQARPRRGGEAARRAPARRSRRRGARPRS